MKVKAYHANLCEISSPGSFDRLLAGKSTDRTMRDEKFSTGGYILLGVGIAAANGDGHGSQMQNQERPRSGELFDRPRYSHLPGLTKALQMETALRKA